MTLIVGVIDKPSTFLISPKLPNCRVLFQVTQSLGVPRAYVRMMCELEDFLNKTLAGEAAGLAALRHLWQFLRAAFFPALLVQGVTVCY